jgi:hypothetical protein
LKRRADRPENRPFGIIDHALLEQLLEQPGTSLYMRFSVSKLIQTSSFEVLLLSFSHFTSACSLAEPYVTLKEKRLKARGRERKERTFYQPLIPDGLTHFFVI